MAVQNSMWSNKRVFFFFLKGIFIPWLPDAICLTVTDVILQQLEFSSHDITFYLVK